MVGYVERVVLASVNLNITPVERVGHIVPYVSFISKKEDIIEAYATSYDTVSYRRDSEAGVETYLRRLQDQH